MFPEHCKSRLAGAPRSATNVKVVSHQSLRWLKRISKVDGDIYPVHKVVPPPEKDPRSANSFCPASSESSSSHDVQRHEPTLRQLGQRCQAVDNIMRPRNMLSHQRNGCVDFTPRTNMYTNIRTETMFRKRRYINHLSLTYSKFSSAASSKAWHCEGYPPNRSTEVLDPTLFPSACSTAW